MGSCNSLAVCRNVKSAKRKERTNDDNTVSNTPRDSNSGSKTSQDGSSTRKKQSENPVSPVAISITVPFKPQKADGSSRKSSTEPLESPQPRKNIFKFSFAKDKIPQTNDNSAGSQNENEQSNENENPVKVSKTAALEYKRGQLVGKGTVGDVYQCLNLNTGQLMAVKTIRFPGALAKARAYCRMVQRELSLINEIPHPNIISYYYVDIVKSSPDESLVDVVFEYGSGGSIRSILDRFQNLEEKISAIYISQILDALFILHRCDIIHGDIKGSNVLIDATGLVKLSDLGVANGSTHLKSCQTLI